MKDAGLPLLSDLVGGRAHQRPVVLVVERGVGQLAPGAVDHRHPGRGHSDVVGRVVEGPGEVEGGRVGHYIAEDVHHLTLAHTVHHRLGLGAHRGV